jgi:hypothetical protein
MMLRVIFMGEVYIVVKIFETVYFTDSGNITFLTYGISLEESSNQKSDFHTYVNALDVKVLPSCYAQIQSEWIRGIANASL